MAAAYAFAPDSSRVGGGGSAFALGIGTSAIAGGNSCSTTVVLFKNHPITQLFWVELLAWALAW